MPKGENTTQIYRTSRHTRLTNFSHLSTLRWRCPPGKRFDEAYLECREKANVLECQAEPDQDDDYPYELVPFEPSQM